MQALQGLQHMPLGPAWPLPQAEQGPWTGPGSGSIALHQQEFVELECLCEPQEVASQGKVMADNLMPGDGG